MDAPPDLKRMRLRRDGTCAGCGGAVLAGTAGAWHAATRSVWCASCTAPATSAAAAASPASERPAAPASPTAPPPPLDSGTAGASAQLEHDRRAAARETRVRQQHPKLGGLLLRLAPEPAHQRAWATGSSGEQAVAAGLEGLDDVLLLHDRRMRGADGRLIRANIDHLVIAPSGVWVVVAKQYAGSLEVRRAGGLLTPRVEQLWVAGRDRSRLLDGVLTQVAAVRAQLEDAPDVPVHGALCFVGTDLPWFGSSSARGVALVGRRGLRKLVRQDGPLDADDRTALANWLAHRLPAA